MTKRTLIGAAAFGLTSALAGYIWVVFEFPFAIALPGVVGWYAVVRPGFGSRKALWAGLVGGVTFTIVLMLSFFFALTDGSPVALPAWAGGVLAAAAAGALTGLLLDRVHGALAMAGFSAAGMLAAVVIAALLRAVAPGSVDLEGAAQSAYFTLVIGLIGAALGAAIGAGAAWLEEHLAGTHAASPHVAP